MTQARLRPPRNRDFKDRRLTTRVPSAGEVEQFAYCAHNWLLARQGFEGPKALSAPGIAGHKRLGEGQVAIERRKKGYRRALSWAFRIVIVALSGVLVTLAVASFDSQHSLASLSLMVVALLLLLTSGGFLTVALLARNRYQDDQVTLGLVPGRLVNTDLAGQAPLLSDPEWDLGGRPDYLLQTQHGAIPVEVKTGKTPERPRRSHLFQLAVYLRLIEATSGKRPEYGLLSYPEGNFRVEWDDSLRGELRSLLDRMETAEATGKADRDHEVVGRCRGCARRDGCEQRLV